MSPNNPCQQPAGWASEQTLRIVRAWAPIVQATGITVALLWGLVIMYIIRLAHFNSRLGALLLALALGLSLGYVLFTSSLRRLSQRAVKATENELLISNLTRPCSICLLCSTLLLIEYLGLSIPAAYLYHRLASEGHEIGTMMVTGTIGSLSYVSAVSLLMRTDIAKLVENARLRVQMRQLWLRKNENTSSCSN